MIILSESYNEVILFSFKTSFFGLKLTNMLEFLTASKLIGLSAYTDVINQNIQVVSNLIHPVDHIKRAKQNCNFQYP